VPVAKPASCTAQLDETSLTLWACPDENGSARCRMYTDDGETSDFAAPEHWKVLESN
jgi:alpha-glucosidase